MKEEPVRPTNDDPRNESGRISRSGTQAGISVGTESTSGGEDPIPPEGVHVDQNPVDRKKDDKKR